MGHGSVTCNHQESHKITRKAFLLVENACAVFRHKVRPRVYLPGKNKDDVSRGVKEKEEERDATPPRWYLQILLYIPQ